MNARLTAAASALALSLLPAFAQAQEGLGLPKRPDQPTEKREEIDASKLSKAPRLKKMVKAEHPKAAVDKGVEAKVVLLLEIDEAGKVKSVSVAEPVTPPDMGFEEAVLAVADQWEFEPAEVKGKPIAIQITFKYKFQLQKPVEAAPTTAAAEGAPAAPPRVPVVNFSGRLLERGTRTPIAGALVTVFREIDGKSVGYEASSNADGVFEFVDLPPGEWKVNAEPPGYYPLKTAEEVRAGEKTGATYWIEKGSYNEYDVVVKASRPRKEVSRTVITAAEISKTPGAAGDPLAVIQNFAGVARTPLFSGQIIVRGAAPEDTQVFVDGVAVPNIYHFGGLRSVLPVDMIDSLQFYPGNFTVQYGRSIGGIIDVDVKKLQPKRFSGAIDVSLLDGSLFLQAPVTSKLNVALGFRRSWIDQVLKAVVPKDAASFNTAPRYYDGQLLVNYRPAPAHDMRAFLFTSDDRVSILFPNPADFDAGLTGNSFSSSTKFYRSVWSYRYVPSPNFENLVRLSQGRDHSKANLGQLKFDIESYLTQLRDTARYKVNDQLTAVGGVDVAFLQFNGLVQLPLPPVEGQPQTTFDATKIVRSDIAKTTYYYVGAFAELEWKPFERLLLLPGVRFDYLPDSQESVPQPRATARLSVTDTLTLKGGVGYFAQDPQFNNGESDKSFGNPKLKSERAMHYSGGIEYKPLPYVSLDATGFYKTVSSLIGPSALFENGKPLRYDNRGRARIYGLEFVAQHQFAHNFTGWLAYTVSRSERHDPDRPGYRLFDYDQTHILTAIAAYVLPRNWQVGGRFRLVSGKPYTPALGDRSTFNSDIDQYEAAYGAVNSRRNAPFHQLDVRIDKRWIYQTWTLNFYLDVQNVYNRGNPEDQGYNYNFREAKATTGLPVFPILGVRADF